jgi:hypothetical protein
MYLAIHDFPVYLYWICQVLVFYHSSVVKVLVNLAGCIVPVSFLPVKVIRVQTADAIFRTSAVRPTNLQALVSDAEALVQLLAIFLFPGEI